MHEWMDYALCREVDLDIFFPDITASPRKAISICNRCEVQIECLEYALKSSVAGVWGGTTEKERKRLKRQAAKVVQH
jgi:WhiB family redox-sensing transcriptional regulator